jgi:hypothetical protein
MENKYPTTGGAAPTTSVPLSFATAANVAIPLYPEWIRLPKVGSQCNWTGLSRSKLNELILPTKANRFTPAVKSICLRKEGAARGGRLVHLRSLLSYLANIADKEGSR